MLNIKGYTAEFVKDPFGILTGERYEFLIDLDVPEDDELYSDQGVYARVIYMVNGDEKRIVKYDLHEKSTNQYLEFDMEPDEEEALAAFCNEHLPEK
jgi:Family of unknown function (DUF6509)